MTCNFTGDPVGMVQAYVVVRPNGTGVTGVRFSAPLPNCFAATFIADVDGPDVLTIGDSQTGISVSLSGCTTLPAHVLTIQYLSAGGTTACCPYPVLADPLVGEVVAANCEFDQVPASGMTSHLNADGSCPCMGNSPPVPPTNPVPLDGQIFVASDIPTMTWESWDPDGDPIQYDVYVGTTTSPPLVAQNLSQPLYHPAQFSDHTQYFWRVVARDDHANETTGPLWTFTTREPNAPPAVPWPIAPTDGQLNFRAENPLIWACGDIDGDSLYFDVYLGTESDPPLVLSNTPFSYYAPAPALLYETDYFWRIVVRDAGGHEVSGPEWTFRTLRFNRAPAAPTLIAPLNEAVEVPLDAVLSWTCSDADGDSLVYDVYFNSSPGLMLVASNIDATTYDPPLLYRKNYYWRIVARDPLGFETASLVSRFGTTTVGTLPVAPHNESPADGATDVSLNSLFEWECSDADGDLIRYDLYFGTEPDPPLVAMNHPNKRFRTDTAIPLTQYYWRIVARDRDGEAPGPTWTFTTRANTLPPQAAGANPPDGGELSIWYRYLSWSASIDPDDHPVTYDVYFGTTDPPDLALAGTTFPYFYTPVLDYQGQYYWRIDVNDPYGTVTGQTWTFTANAVPVLITRFDARETDGGVELSWKLEADEAIDGFTLYRREGSAAKSVAIANGDVKGTSQSYLDASVQGATTYHYELLIRTTDGDTYRSQITTLTTRALVLSLHQNHPNPFNPRTTIAYDLPVAATSQRVRLLILDVAGRVVRTLVDEEQRGGSYRLEWEGKDDSGATVSSGVYISLLDVGGERRTRKLVLLK